MAYYFSEPSHTFNEYLLVPGYSSAECIPDNVSLETPLMINLSGESIAIQGLLDGIIPGILPLAAVWGIYTYMRKAKKVNFPALVLVVLAICLLGSLIGIL